MDFNQYFCSIEQIYIMSASIILARYHIVGSGESIGYGPIILLPYVEDRRYALEIRLNYRFYQIIKWIQESGYKIIDTPNPYRITSDRIYSVMLI